MPRVLNPIQFVMIALAGWMNQRQLQTIEYLREENRVLREQLGSRRVRFNDNQRRRLGSQGERLGTETSSGSRRPSYTRDFNGVASKTYCSEI